MILAVTISVMTLFLWLGFTLDAQMPATPPGETSIMNWKGGKKAVFLLGFDDSCPSHIDNAIPELQKRGLVGTFYINVGSGPYKSRQADWAAIANNPSVVLGNHTFTHVGASSVQQLDTELARANEAIFALRPDLKHPRLLSFARPGGVPWTVAAKDADELRAKHNLLQRPAFQGPPFTFKTLGEAYQLIDAAIERGEMAQLVFHGVGGDWHVVPMDYYVPLLDKLQANRDRIWVTDHISYAKYLEERQLAKVTVVSADDRQIRLTLSAHTDASLYDQPLTLKTRVPVGWKTCSVTQGQIKDNFTVVDGTVQYDASPGGETIVLHPGIELP